MDRPTCYVMEDRPADLLVTPDPNLESMPPVWISQDAYELHLKLGFRITVRDTWEDYVERRSGA